MTRYARFNTPLGTMTAIAEEDELVCLDFADAKYAPTVEEDWLEFPDFAPLRACREQLAEYFAGTRDRFDLPLAARGTPFQQRIWRAIARVPYGRTLSYSELASNAGASGSARAAGAATGRNPIAIVVPCHRILGSGGALTGYAGGLGRKTRLLALERAREVAAA